MNDIEYLYKLRNQAKNKSEWRKLTRQINILKDALSIYNLAKSKTRYKSK